MFCSNCGNELRQGLKYCNRCGAINPTELEKTISPSDVSKIIGILSSSIGAVGVFGIIALTVLIIKLLNKEHIEPPAFLLVLVLGAVIFGVIFLLIRQISVMSNKSFWSAQKEGAGARHESLPHTGNTAQLEPPRQPIGSVTDHTTRIFEENLAEKTKN